MNRIFMLALISAGVFAATPAFGAGGNVRDEISTAIEHSGYASEVKTTAGVHLHLHHVVNCLVGPHGHGFYPPAGDPCHGMGNGALNDLSGNSRTRDELRRALREAKVGLREKGFEPAHATALRVRKMLEAAEARLKE